MNRFLLSLFLLLFSFITYSQQYWPHTFNRPNCLTMSPPSTTCTKLALGGDWEVPGTWSPAGVPKNDDVVCIPANVTVNIKGQIYKESSSCPPLANTIDSPRLQIFVCGKIQFYNSGKLYLACFSFIQVYSGGIILAPTSGSGSSDLIQIGTNVVWGGPNTGNQGDINGPYVLSWPYIGAGILPVAITYFKAELKQPNAVRLEWATSRELDNSEFIIERSVDQKTWSNIGSIASAENGNNRQIYNHIDKHPLIGINYYRLKQVDISGQITYSEIIRFNNLVRKSLLIFPNPVNSTSQLYSKVLFKAGQIIQIIDARGIRLKTINTNGGNSMQIDFSTLKPGVYLLQLVENGRIIESISVVKQ